jgi:diguanylate cyclase (GGDEF)-like protein
MPVSAKHIFVDTESAGADTDGAGSTAVELAWRQSRLLDSVAEFTDHRDIAALDHSLVLSLAELVGARTVALCKRTGGNTETFGLDSVVRCTPDLSGAYVVQAFDVKLESDIDILLRQSMQELKPRMETVAGGVQRLVVPIRHEGRAIGALLLESERELAQVRPLVDGFVRIYANYTVLLNESERDKLTGLYNRRTFERQLQRLLKQCGALRQSRSPVPSERRRAHEGTTAQVWLAILDIDHFKRINDVYGHVYGDEVILLIAQKMRANFRHNDVLFRFGGEEFVILLSAADAAIAQISLERFRAAVAAFEFPQVGHVTVSIGYARVGEHDYPEVAIDCADKALYFAKKNGRNRVYCYEDLTLQAELAPASIGSIDLF